MSNSRSRTDTIVLVTLFIGIVALYISSFYIGTIEGVGFNNLVSNARFLVDRIVFPIFWGSFLASILEIVFPQYLFSYFMAGSGIKPIFNALWIGIFSKKCSSEIVHSSISMNKSGVSLGASITYLLATPINSISIIFLLISLFGWQDGGYLLMVILLISLITGIVIDLLQSFKIIKSQQIVSRVSIDFSIFDSLIKHFNSLFIGFKNIKEIRAFAIDIFFILLDKLLYSSKWVILGVLLGSLFAGGLEESHIQFLVGPSVLSLFIVFILAGVIEIFDEGVLVMSFLFFHLTGALGTAFIFLMGAHLLDTLESGDLRKGIGNKTTILILIVSSLFLFISGYILN